MRISRLSCIAAICLLAVGSALAGTTTNFVLGGRALDEDDHEPVDQHVALGVTVDFGKDSWPINLAAGLQFSRAEEDLSGVTLTSTISELSFGVLKTWDNSKARPYVGGGVAAVNFDAEGSLGGISVSQDDTSSGVYVQGGIYWRAGNRFNIGIGARVMQGTDITVFGVELDANYYQLGLILGWGPSN